MIHKAFNKSEIAKRYYKALGSFTTREQAKKNFAGIKNYNFDVLNHVLNEIWNEQQQLLGNSKKIIK